MTTRSRGPLILICALVSAGFLLTVIERTPNAGVLSYGHHEWLTAHCLKFARTWWQEGAISLDLLMIETPRDIEHPTLDSRVIYPSYPPGAVLVPYAFARLINTEPTVAFLMSFNLGLHLFISLCLSLAVWFWLSFQRVPARLVASVLPGIIYLFLPGPMYWQQNVYFTDTAVIAPLALLLAVLAFETRGTSPATQCATGFAFAWGYFTDWLFLSVALVFVAMRVLEHATVRGPLSLLLRRLAPPGIASFIVFGFYAWQLDTHSLWEKWEAKLSLRTYGTGDGAELLSSNFNETVWGTYSRDQYGHLGTILILISVLFAIGYVWEVTRRIRTRSDEAWSFAHADFVAIATFAPILHTYILKNHSYLHDFSVLKFAVILSCIPFSLVPAVVAHCLRPTFRHGRWLLPGTASLVAITYVSVLHRRYAGMVPPRNPEIAQMGYFINKATGYDDVVFSSFAKAEPYPSEPHLLSHSLKLIHQVDGLRQLRDWAQTLPIPANVVWFGTTEREQEPPGGKRVWSDAARASEGSFYLLRLSREAFLANSADAPPDFGN